MIEEIGRIKISDYDYELPDYRIAKHPLEKRDESKLLIYKDCKISESVFKNISKLLPNNSLLIANNTKVVKARLKFRKQTGALVEVFLLEPVEPSDYETSFGSIGSSTWKCLVGNLKRWKNGPLELEVPKLNVKLIACKQKILTEGLEVKFSWNGDITFAQLIEGIGEIPIPPYLNRASDATDVTRYQTVYAKPEGSVAAPTAGLHFTKDVFTSLAHKGIVPDYVTLHVGAGTFKPVKAENIDNHEMHTEHFFVSKELVKKIATGNNFIAIVGTTTLRTVESLYWLGVRAKKGTLEPPFFVSQWDPYQENVSVSLSDAYVALYEYINSNKIDILSASTQIMIAPGYKIRVADALITNFHQPRSTLLLLVSALVGDMWRDIYKYALENNFRFLSYGDSNILFNPNKLE